MKLSAGILAYRRREAPEILLVHPGGPFFSKKDLGTWSIPKGEYIGEDPFEVAKREFTEETGNIIDKTKHFIELNEVKLRSGKRICAWAVECDFESSFISSNMFELEWPPKSGKIKLFPEVDRAEWFTIQQAREKINPAQANFLDQLESILAKKS